MRRILIAAAAMIAAYSFSATNAHAQGAPAPVVPPSAHGPFWPNGWVPWVAFGCPASIIVSGIVADFKDHRQLTYWEAWTCGLLYWIPLPPQPPKGRHHHHTSALIIDRPRYG